MSPEDTSYLFKPPDQLNGALSTLVQVDTPKRKLLQGSRTYARQLVEAMVKLNQKALNTIENDLAIKGLLGVHTLVGNPTLGRGNWGDIQGEWKLDGSLFLLIGQLTGRGNLEGETRTVSSVQFAWSPHDNEVIVTELPLDKVIFQENKEIVTPQISFTFNPDQFMRTGFDVYSKHVLQFPNPNDYLRGDRLAVAHLMASSETGLSIPPFFPASST